MLTDYIILLFQLLFPAISVSCHLCSLFVNYVNGNSFQCKALCVSVGACVL